MRAALVQVLGHPPKLGSFPIPTADSSHVLVRVKASAVTNVVRGVASGSHYSAAPQLPFVVGLDGVGHLLDDPSSRVYFSFPTPPLGALADVVAVARTHIIPVPASLSDVEAAALANPALSCWVALTRRTQLKLGETILINGATGAAGRMAVQVAKHLGAGRIVATGRNAQRLEEAKAMGATDVIVLDGSKEEMVGRFKAVVRGGLDVILDYLWGASAEQLMAALVNAGSRTEPARRIRWVNVGSASGQFVNLATAPFRSSNLEFSGSGLGSEPDGVLMEAIGEAMAVAKEAGFRVDTWTAPIEDVEQAWQAEERHKRLVITL